MKCNEFILNLNWVLIHAIYINFVLSYLAYYMQFKNVLYEIQHSIVYF